VSLKRISTYASQLKVELDEYYKRITGNYKTPSLVDVFEQRIEELEELVGSSYSKSTLVIYQRTLNHLKRFLERSDKKDILLRNINEGFLRRFFEYLRITMSTNSANKYMRKVNAVLNYADRNGLLENSKVVTMSLKDDKTSPVYLTEEELQTIMNKEITIQRLHRIRDVFVFMCYISFAYADVKGLKPEHIIIEDGKEYIIKPRKKTEIQASVPLLQQTKELLKKYEFMQLEDKCFPVPSSQKMNAYLQELAAICGINKHLTSHVGRHTFATMMLNKGMRPETLYRIMGLSSQKHLDIYAKMLKITLYNEMEKVLNIEQL
jgi:integrase